METCRAAVITEHNKPLTIERVPIPDELVPADAQVEMAAKKATGYYAGPAAEPLPPAATVGRALDKN